MISYRNSVKNAMLLYAVTDRAWTGKQTLFEQVEAALKGGVTCVQLREKNLGEAEFFEEARIMAELCHKYDVPFIVNDNAEIAVKCGADGVHVGQSDMKAADVRSIIGEDMILGVSAKTVEQALEAEKAGADYLGVGAAFSTGTKLDASVVSHDIYRSISSAISIPIVAIGGINKENILQLKGCGASGAALVSAIFAAENIEKECIELRKLCAEMAGE